MTVLSAASVAKTFTEGRDPVHVLRGVTLTLDRGEIVTLEGPSGSGKTTLLSILGCILTASAGRVAVDGVPVDPDRPELLPGIRRKSIGFVFQQFNLFPALTAVENVEYALNIKGVKGAAARREAEAVLEAVGLGDRKDFLPRDLSGGQKQRVAVARALAGHPPILLADEPTANLDSHTADGILDLMREVSASGGVAFLFATHDPRVVARAQRVVSLHDGRVESDVAR
jgi:putative ABC transport system ATP-binding protein